MRRHVHALFAVSLLISAPSFGQMILPTGFTATDLISSGLSSATCMCVAPDGTIYIAQQNGGLRVWREGAGLLATQFFANQPLNVNTSGERGLIGVALDPNFVSNRFVYVHYTINSTPRHGRISRFTADADGNLALPGSEAILLELDNLSSIFHNGGAMHFGPDGKLYIGVGENFVSSNSQSITSLLGKILRINPVPGDVIPSDNPTSFPGISGTPTGNYRAIWAVGLRNPFTFAFQPGTGRMFINDVGDSAFEEIDEGAPGRNFGWPATEGMFDSSQYPAFTAPFHAYQHNPDFGGGVCIIGGVFCDSQTSNFPASFDGDYLFADFQQNSWIRRLDLETREVSDFAWLFNSPVDLDFDAQGRMLLLIGGKLTRIQYTQQLPECHQFEEEQLHAANAQDGAGFGISTALSGNTCVVGAPYHDSGGIIDTGAAYIFTRSGTTWSQQAMLTAPDGAIGDIFGWSVAIHEDRVIIGAPFHDSEGVSAGAAYVFLRSGATWTLEKELVAPILQGQDFFGTAVALSADAALVGASRRDIGTRTDVGAAELFYRDGTTWTHHATFSPLDLPNYAHFGGSVALSADTALVGAGSAIMSAGRAYVFTREGNEWNQQARLEAQNASAGDGFGGAVSLSGSDALIGAAAAAPQGMTNAGTAYFFARSGGIWNQVAQFLPENQGAWSFFGGAVCVADDRAIVGAPYRSHQGELFHGAAFVYARSNGTWTLDPILAASDGAQNNSFGESVAIDEFSAVASAYRIDPFGAMNAGTLYIFGVGSMPGDLNQDSAVNLSDVLIFLNVLLDVDSDPCHAAGADLNRDGVADGSDISKLVTIIIGD